MGKIDEVQVSIKINGEEELAEEEQSLREIGKAFGYEPEDVYDDEPEDPEGDAFAEGYEEGFNDGWEAAMSEVIGIMEDHDMDFGCMDDEPEDETADLGDAFEEDTLALGRRGEDAAVRFLKHAGYEILERNWRCTFGEADIIAEDEDGTIVFIEVKTRRGIAAGMPEDAITRKKQQKYERIAMAYMTTHDYGDDTALRFDAIGICVNSSHHAMLRHHIGCFDGRR